MSLSTPRVSVIMATRNRLQLLQAALPGIQCQTLQDWELVISDDGSTDGTEAAVREMQQQENRIVYVRSERNRGIPQTYNQGFQNSRGEYIAMHDDDDLWRDRDKLKKQVAFLDENNDYVVCGSGMIVIDESGSERYRFLKVETDAEIRRTMLFFNPMANSTTLFRRCGGDKVGWYNEAFPHASDWDFWLKLGLVGKLYNFPEYFAFYTAHERNTSFVRARDNLFWALRVVRRYREDYPAYHAALCFHYIQCAYGLLPRAIQRRIHGPLRKLKQKAHLLKHG